MAAETPKVPLRPEEMTPKRGEEPQGLAELDSVAPNYREFALGVIALLPLLKGLNMHEVDIVLEVSDEVSGIVKIRSEEEGLPRVSVIGRLGGNAIRGVPYTATWNGSFYRRAHPDQPYIVDGDHVEVEKGQMIAWGFVDKNTQWPIESDKAGIVHFVTENGDETVAGETILYYIEAKK